MANMRRYRRGRLLLIMVAGWAFPGVLWAAPATLGATATEAAAADETSPAGSDAAGRLVLDDSAYVQAYYEFGLDRVDSALLKSKGAKLLGEKGLAALERETKTVLADKKIASNERGVGGFTVLGIRPKDDPREVRYRVYRHNQPIIAANFGAAQLLGSAGP